MKNVFLIGDSIRFGASPESPGYGVFVKENLSGIANVYSPDDNCRFAQYTLRYLYDWAKELEKDVPLDKIDVVHWNNGLWDVLRLNGDEPLTPSDVYVYMLKRVHNMIKKLFPNAKIIFSLSTAVIEEWANPLFFRYNSDIEEYNKAAKELMETLNVKVIDLYALTSKFQNDMHSDWVHFGYDGSKAIADVVTKEIMCELC